MYNEVLEPTRSKIVHERLQGGFNLGDYHVEPGTGWLTGPGGRVHLAPRLVKLLICLAAKAPAVLSHDELIRFVWGENPGGHERLSHAIGELRRALHDEAAAPRFIETLPMRGYRLMVVPSKGSQVRQAATIDGPADGISRDSDFFSELRDRGVLETAIAYLVAGWLLIQVADVTFDQLRLPASAATFVTYLTIIGFPIAVLLAWFIERTPRGLVVDRDGRAGGRRPILTKTYVSIVAALTLASISLFALDRYIGLPSEIFASGAETSDPQLGIESNSIAVLRFANITDTEDGAVLSEGLAEDIRNTLAEVPTLKVSSRVDSFSLDPNSSSDEVRRRLGVAYHIEGSVQDYGSGGQVAVNLIDSATGVYRLSLPFTYDREDFSDFLAIKDVIRDEAVDYLRVAFPEETQATDIAEENPGRDAYLSYRRGIMELYKPTTAETMTNAVSYFEDALAIHPDYAAAHAGICRAYAQGYSTINDTTLIERAKVECDLALNNSASLDIVYQARGDLFRSTGDTVRAEEAYRAALEINESSVGAAIGLGLVYDDLGDDDAAEAQFLTAIDLQPPGYWRAHSGLGRFYVRRGRYEKAAEQYQKIVDIDQNNMDGWSNLGNALALSGDFGAALDALRNSLEIEPRAATYSSIGMLHYYRGDFSLAREQLRKAADLDPDDHATQSNLGDILTAAGDETGAREAFRRARALANRRLEVNELDYQISTDLAWINAMLGDLQAAENLLDGVLDTQPNDPYVHYINALVATRRGEHAAALNSLQRAVELGYARAFIRAEPHLSALHSYPRFASLITEQSGYAR